VRDRAGGRLRLELGPREGGFAVPNRRVRAVFHAALPPRQVYLDARPLAPGSVLPGFASTDGRVEVMFEDDGHARSIELDPAP